jgi:hypothetical protein
VNSSTRISIYIVLEIALSQICIKVRTLDDIVMIPFFCLIVKLLMHLNLPITWSRKFWYPSFIGSFMVIQQVSLYPNTTMTITRWANHLYSASVNFGSQVRYIIIENLINESLSFRTILTKVAFVMTSVASLMLDSTCFVLGLPLGIFILAHVLVKCHFEAFVALPWSSKNFCQNRVLWFAKPDSPVFTDLLRLFFSWTINYIVAFFFATKTPSLR